MKKLRIIFCTMFSIILGIISGSCKKENTPTALQLQNPTVYSNDYYIKLRAYKASNHAKCFIWLADYNINGAVSASLGERFLGVPDSVDIISLWGGIPNPVKNPNDYKEMKFVQQVKGTKMLAVVIVRIGSYPMDDSGIRQYVQNLKQQVYENDLDGLDLDYETDQFFGNNDNFVKLVAGLSQFLGPKSGTGKILDIDYTGYPNPPSVLGPYVDFIVEQDYFVSSSSILQDRYNQVQAYISPEKYFATEDIGDAWQTGGVRFTDTTGTITNSLLGFSKWNPTQGRKGGFGGFFAQRDYYNPIPYGYLNAAIQACNPAKK